MTQVAGAIGAHIIDLIKRALGQIGAMNVSGADVRSRDDDLASFSGLSFNSVIENVDFAIGLRLANWQWTIFLDHIFIKANGCCCNSRFGGAIRVPNLGTWKTRQQTAGHFRCESLAAEPKFVDLRNHLLVERWFRQTKLSEGWSRN